METDQPTQAVAYFLTHKRILEIVEYAYGFVELGDVAAVGEVLSDLGEQIRAHLEYTSKDTTRARKKARRDKRRKLRKDASATGLDRLAIDNGHESYAAYLVSPHWRDFQKRYAKAWPNCRCMACESKSYHLHHVNYERLGSERLQDALPLCKACHEKLHATHKSTKIPVARFKDALVVAFQWGPAELARRLIPYGFMAG